MGDNMILKDYQNLLLDISSIQSRIVEIINQTSAMLDTIHTGYDFIETEFQGQQDQNLGDVALNLLTLGTYGQVRAHVRVAEVNSDIKDTVASIRNALQPLQKYLCEGNNLLTVFTGALDGLQNADASRAEEIYRILESYSLTTACKVEMSKTSISDIQAKTEHSSFEVKKHDSYGTMSLRQAFLGDFTDDCTMAGAGMGLALQFVPIVDTIMDIRDVCADAKNITEYEMEGDRSFGKSAEIYGFTTLDIAAFIPFVGCAKYVDDFADAGKTMGKVADVGKQIDNINDARKSMKRAEDIVQAAKQSAKSGDNIVDAGKAANKASDAGKAMDAGKSAGKAADAGKATDAGKSAGNVTDAGKATNNSSDVRKAGRTPRESELNTQRILDNSSDDFTHQTILDENLNSISKREAGSIAPDHMAAYDVNGNVIKGDNYSGASHFEIIEDKNYSIENSSGRGNLIQNIVEQAENRNARLSQNGATVHQTYRIDVTGHDSISLNNIESLYNRLLEKLPDNVDIEFVLK